MIKYKVGDKLKVSKEHGFFSNMSEKWIYRGLAEGGFHVVRNPETGEEFSSLLEITLEIYF